MFSNQPLSFSFLPFHSLWHCWSWRPFHLQSRSCLQTYIPEVQDYSFYTVTLLNYSLFLLKNPHCHSPGIIDLSSPFWMFSVLVFLNNLLWTLLFSLYGEIPQNNLFYCSSSFFSMYFQDSLSFLRNSLFFRFFALFSSSPTFYLH